MKSTWTTIQVNPSEFVFVQSFCTLISYKFWKAHPNHFSKLFRMDEFSKKLSVSHLGIRYTVYIITYNLYIIFRLNALFWMGIPNIGQ